MQSLPKTRRMERPSGFKHDGRYPELIAFAMDFFSKLHTPTGTLGRTFKIEAAGIQYQSRIDPPLFANQILAYGFSV